MQWYVICYQWFKQGLMTERQRSQFRVYTVEPSVPAREFNLEASGQPGPRPWLVCHRSQAARTATLPLAPPGQADHHHHQSTAVDK